VIGIRTKKIEFWIRGSRRNYLKSYRSSLESIGGMKTRERFQANKTFAKIYGLQKNQFSCSENLTKIFIHFSAHENQFFCNKNFVPIKVHTV